MSTDHKTVSKEKALLYPFVTSSSLILVIWCHFPAIWLVEESSVLPPGGDFFIFPCFSVQKGQFCSRLWWEKTCILAQFWVECIRLARLVSSGESTRHVLVEELAAGKSPYISTFHLGMIISRLAVWHYVIHRLHLFTQDNRCWQVVCLTLQGLYIGLATLWFCYLGHTLVK